MNSSFAPMLPPTVRNMVPRVVLPGPPPELGGLTMNDSRRGVVLVAVLWLIALLSALAMAASITFRGFAGVIVLDRDRVQTEALLTGGLEAAVQTVQILGNTPLD